MGVRVRRDLEETRQTLSDWLATKFGVGEVVVSDLVLPRAGFSNETIFYKASWTDRDGAPKQRRFVLRIEPTAHQLFASPDALLQARVMDTLGRNSSIPVPSVWLTEDDPAVLGAPFFVMEQVDGRIPSDVPSWHHRGWTVDLRPEQRSTLYDNGLSALAQLHQLDWRPNFEFLAPPHAGSALDAYLEQLQSWYNWCEPSRRYDVAVIDAALEYVLRNRPADGEEGLVWGDARVGNMIFADNLTVATLLDWETATVGPPEIDLGWWLVFEEFLCEAQGLQRLEGVPGRNATVARYAELSGRPVSNIFYYEVLAGLVLALINSRLADLLIADGRVPEVTAAEYVTRVTGMLARRLG